MGYELTKGTKLNNRYVIECTLGSGGFGTTYKAMDTLIDVPVAIKEYENSSEILRALESKAPPISLRTYYARREEAIELLSSVLWGYIPIE